VTAKPRKGRPAAATPTARRGLPRRLADWWFAAVPAERLAGLRILIGAFAVYYLWGRYNHLVGSTLLPPANWKPVGVVGLVLDRPLDLVVWTAIVIATLGLAFAFVAGVLYRVTAPVFAVLLLFTLSYRNSWTMVFHTENLLVLQVCALALAPAADAWSIDRWWRARRGAAPPTPDGKYAWAIRTAAVLTVATYVLAGIAKLRLTGIDWLDGDQLRNQIAFDNLRKALLGDHVARLALPLLEHPSLFIGLSIMTMLVELGAPIALLGGRIAGLWAVTAWGFHVGVVALMAIVFPYPLSGVAYAPLFRVERPIGWIGKRLASIPARIRKR
jgi:hypothetical protein